MLRLPIFGSTVIGRHYSSIFVCDYTRPSPSQPNPIPCPDRGKSVPLVPVFSFGENELFDQVENPPGSWLRCTQEFLQRFMGISLPLFHARGIFQYSFGLLPYRQPIFTVGKPSLINWCLGANLSQ
ncbi:hypothetical protein JD844_033667 [Phrynosoma platyrhinos]|uniref:Uncharacterized protein n=1 Tax=Phrynosoma platyrhinos TaxID=52577 RepID=A0ABQ7T726_PHRPL|nr:hypothetical protein JD844_033667 [Phrynosoma platyrhinos]